MGKQNLLELTGSILIEINKELRETTPQNPKWVHLIAQKKMLTAQYMNLKSKQ